MSISPVFLDLLLHEKRVSASSRAPYDSIELAVFRSILSSHLFIGGCDPEFSIFD